MRWFWRFLWRLGFVDDYQMCRIDFDRLHPDDKDFVRVIGEDPETKRRRGDFRRYDPPNL